MNILTINAEDWYNGSIPAEDKNWDRLEYRVDKMLQPMMDELDKYKKEIKRDKISYLIPLIITFFL